MVEVVGVGPSMLMEQAVTVVQLVGPLPRGPCGIHASRRLIPCVLMLFHDDAQQQLQQPQSLQPQHECVCVCVCVCVCAAVAVPIPLAVGTDSLHTPM